MSGIIKKVEQKLGDHPNVSGDDNVTPDSGTGIGANQGDDQGKSWVTNKVQAGMGSGDPNEGGPKAGNTTAPDTKSAGEASGSIGDTR